MLALAQAREGRRADIMARGAQRRRHPVVAPSAVAPAMHQDKRRHPSRSFVAFGAKLALPRQLVLDEFSERLDRLRTGERHAVDEDAGSDVHSGLPAALDRLADRRVVPLRFEAPSELVSIEPELRGPLLEI